VVKNAEFASNARERSVSARILLGWLVVTCSASCGRAPSLRYYTLRMSAPPAAGDPAQRATTFVLGVEPFRGPDLLRDERILYYDSPTQLGFYEQHRWAAEPAAMLQELTLRRLQQTGVFAQVQSAPEREPVDYVLKGRVLSLEEVDYPETPSGPGRGGVRARAGLEVSLLRSHDRKVVWSVRRQAESAVQAEGVTGVVNALDEAVNRILEEITHAIVAQVESDFQASAGRATP
jgi:ABC-type uncharacterized transport system auxiliary subunit